MKFEAICFICNSPVVYKTTSAASSDYHYYGGYLCWHCQDRGLGYFLHTLKDLTDKVLEKELQKLAKKIERNRKLKGKWWDKKSPLFKALIVKKVKLTYE